MCYKVFSNDGTLPRDAVVLNKHTTISKLNHYSLRARDVHRLNFSTVLQQFIVKYVHSKVCFGILRDRNLGITSRLMTMTAVPYKFTKKLG